MPDSVLASRNHSLKNRLEGLIDSLELNLVERQTAIRLAILSLLSGEHLLLTGVPGTAKSALARRLHTALVDGAYFERLLTRFSVPEELFGPLSIKGLESDRYHRLTTGYLPSSSVAFIDEIFKANSAILNTLLTLLNEREFDNGDVRVKTPLMTVVGASNELPAEEDVQALYDRFLIRYEVKPVSDENFISLLSVPDDISLNDSCQYAFTHQEIHDIQQKANLIEISDDIKLLIKSLRQLLQEKKVFISDRRWKKAVGLLKIIAFTNGQIKADFLDCIILKHILWNQPEDRKLFEIWLCEQIESQTGFNYTSLDKLVGLWEKGISDNHNNEQSLSENNALTGDANPQSSQPPVSKKYLGPPDLADRSNKGMGYTFEQLKKYFFDDYYHNRHIKGKWQHLSEYVADINNHLGGNASVSVGETNNTGINSKTVLKDVSSVLSEVTQLVSEVKKYVKTNLLQAQEHIWFDKIEYQWLESALNKFLYDAEKIKSRMQKIFDVYNRLDVKSIESIDASIL